MSGTIGYLGPQGTFSEEALIAWIGADQASSEQALLAGQMQPVSLAHFDGLT